ncbi:unnamed protein product [Orchesella dallaii]|uniref:Uncharacterized protein n=1 Tax=Orchesella dallaii TaxID=48710 RepID=A0ABP1RGB7_9HEXA
MGDQISVILYFISAATFYAFGADVSDQVKTVENWISKATLENDRLNCIPTEQTQVILHEIQERRIGIHCGKITLTYSMVANIMGVVMTYFIICVQFRLDLEERGENL